MQPDDLKDFDDLDNLVGGALEQLPAPRAPRSLLPRVMTALEVNQAAQRSGPRARPWLAWPLAWQVASLAVVMAVSIGVWRLWPHTVSVVAWFTLLHARARARDVRRLRGLRCGTGASRF